MRKILLTICLWLPANRVNSQPEVIYHVFQRSFFDSNGDGNGDLPGIKQKLDYLQDLGVTSILLTPLYLSDFYHNYFANDFEKIDPAYGSMADYLALVKEIHQRKMKIYQDVEMQYVTGEHQWFTDSYKNPSSPFSNYLLYNDRKNEQPYWFFGVPEFTTYNNSREQIIMVNMKSPAVRDYTQKLLTFWLDPNGDGKFEDGVDGYRLDHMMDDLDHAGKLTQLFSGFWAPLLASLRQRNPAIRIVAEQANWGSYGFEYLSEGKVDRVFAFRLKHAIESFDKASIMKAADSCFLKQESQVVFIENHDTKRFASTVNQDPGKLRAGAALNILPGGIPSIYYGQELGMTGAQLKGATDGNDIPIREAFDWYGSGTGSGMALWYKGTGVWWDSSTVRPNDGISLEEQYSDSLSLFNCYKKLLRIRKETPALADGQYQPVMNENSYILSFARIAAQQKVLVFINLSSMPQAAEIPVKDKVTVMKIAGAGNFTRTAAGIRSAIQPYGYLILQY